MPSMRMFGRRWLIGTDDLVFPGLLELLMRGIWLALMSCALYRYYHWTFNCATGGLFVRIYLIGIVAMHAIIILLVMFMVNRSAQGAIYDTKARRIVPRLLMMKIFLLIPEVVLNIFGTIWTYTKCIQCDNEHFTNSVVELGVLFNWIVLGGLIFVLAMVLDPVGSLKFQEGTNGNADVDMLLHRKITRIWVRRFRWIFCWLIRDEHSREAFSQAASIMSSIFRNTDIIPSDFIAGFVLLRVKQKRESREQRRLALLAEQRYNCTSIVSECFTQKPSWMCLKKARHYLQLSISIYGWPFLIYRYCITGFFKMIPKFLCCACFRTKPTVIQEDNCCLCNFAAVRYMSKLHSKDILYASFVNHIFELPFFVALDHETSSIVISIRGSLSMRDVFTDLTAVVEKLDVEGVPPDSYAHKGMLHSAKYIKSELEDHNIIEKALINFPEYNLVITGHSLGAGTAVLLAFYMRPIYPNLKVYAFATPAGLLSREAARIAEEFTLSVGVGDDMVMHLTIDNVEDLRTNMVNVLQSCRLPKYRVFLNGFGYALFGVPSRDLESTWRHRTPSGIRNSPLLSQNSPVLSMITQNDGFPNDNISNHNLVQPIATYPFEQPIYHLETRRYSKIRLYTPGHILHITKKKKSKEQKRADKKSGTNSNEYNYEMRWASPEDFKELRVMPRMFLDHLPENVLKTIDCVLKEQKTEIGFDLAQLSII
ncbi:diacylglycerol lipase-beta [Daktulosphaira vitifoliae]|uniref:diacylglycerol lipase-beta n=1 Tax=Daktulosphaira vitifoliae TaxID=58002 RepID=UPI0021AA2387|nr:diacylglycerol lipase-beta [Daktulosphaira vitifoliae]XP_050533464.1 diacylglycerol lipase-beta [Daktulosphaira vitifoliae]XP_050533465.1 diacylglycerol lipase-beta [Daktulosphaira vitifoliae]XP_050533467.1 diacylglycerol lipase-beta [Daktulosphaira vitifoliae]